MSNGMVGFIVGLVMGTVFSAAVMAYIYFYTRTKTTGLEIPVSAETPIVHHHRFRSFFLED